MFAAAIIVFRESLEASLVIGIMAAATTGIPFRGRWISGGVIVGFFGAALVASSMQAISSWASGMGQELFNAAILSLAVVMLAWHNIWMSSHGKHMAVEAKNAAQSISGGSRAQSVIFVIVSLAVLREGAETVLFLYGLAASSADGFRDAISGGLVGLGAGVFVGGLLYVGLLRIPLRWFFTITGLFVLLLAGSMASQVAHFLIQADFLPTWGSPIWNTSDWLSQSSAVGTLLHGLIGYDEQPAGMQIVFYTTVIAAISAGMVWVHQREKTAIPM